MSLYLHHRYEKETILQVFLCIFWPAGFNTTVTTVIFTWALSTCSVMISTHAKHMINYHTMVIMPHSHHHLTCMTWTSGENQVTDTNTETKPTVSNKTVIWSKIDIPRKIACLQLDSLCLNLVVSAFVSFSVTCTFLDYMTMSWWLIKWRTWRTKTSRSRMPLSAKWNGRTLKWLYVLSPSHTLVMCLSVNIFFSLIFHN